MSVPLTKNQLELDLKPSYPAEFLKPMYIFDIDGTLADSLHRIPHIKGEHKDWETFDSLGHLDEPIHGIINIAKELFCAGYTIMLLTGRGERVRKDTEEWLEKYGVRYHYLIMRGLDDQRPDTEIKRENLEQFLTFNPEYDIQIIFEDRKRLVEMFREEGYHVCQVAEGDF